MCTFAKARIVDDQTISLKQDGKEVLLRVATPNAKAYIMNNNSGNWYDVKNKGSRVGFAATVAAGGNCTLKVEIIPQM
jgi:hypothetical protein